MDKKLTIGMATYDDYDGVFFTIQSLRMHHRICNTDAVQFVVMTQTQVVLTAKKSKPS